jgi:putative nucleotidyltransferase with HDIG domain
MLTPQPAPFRLEWPPLLARLQPILAKSASPVYLVGGAVRDAVLRRPIHDLDFATAEDGCRIARTIANRLKGAYYPLDVERGVGRAIIENDGDRFVIDIARFRGDSLESDLAARDFTMNAVAVLVDEGELQEIIDPLNGLADLHKKQLRRCAPDSIKSDPVRALRAVRQSVALQLLIEPETRADMRKYGPGIANVSVERVRDEFMTMLGGPRPHAALRVLDTLGLLRLILPEVEAMRGVAQSPPHVYDVWEHTLNVVERLDGVITTISPQRTSDSAADSAYGMIVYLLDRFRRNLQNHLAVPLPNERSVRALLVLAALLHDCAKPMTRSVDEDGRIHFYKHELVGADLARERGAALRLGNDEINRLAATVRHHMRPMNLKMTQNMALNDLASLSRRTLYRYWNRTEGAGVDVCILTLADYLGMVGPTLVLQDWIAHLQMIGALLDGYFNQRHTVVSPPPLVSGHDLMETLTLPPGPLIGRLLSRIEEAQASGDIENREQAIALARNLLDTPLDEVDE